MSSDNGTVDGTDGSHQSTLTGERVETDDLVLSAYVGDNAEVFPKVLSLHVADEATVADVTCGQLVFWKRVSPERYDVLATDIDPEKSRDSSGGIDCRDLPYSENSMDAVVLDPPYASGFFRQNEASRPGVGSHSSFRDAYSSGVAHNGTGTDHQAVLDLYCAAGEEAARVLRTDGTLIVKVQDEVSANTQELTHVQITRAYEEFGFETVDLFIVVRPSRPSVSGLHEQVHARKNHSYFMVFQKTDSS